MKIRRKAFALAGAVAAASVLFPAPAANAAAYQCDRYLLCLYDYTDGTGRFYAGSADCNTLIDIGRSGRGDRASAFYNNGNRHVLLLNWHAKWNEWRVVYPALPGDKGTLVGYGNNEVDAVSYGCGRFYDPDS
ncbi:peptidase inhibitor family I36 [Actinomadura pelletieri DSM 43383]|uniref:Peptidase inhibitor family I36 n=1 Tax=Actinomadura pelletieri DSM 43383 TaxID=1120940 RepID=A0A495QA13_9ACTN|nr:peptidase inhibitor family I36 protein [Actinomadura pelletieri]RKS68348.1 peptidase inhibitor family I36 [Actinomadura pelletieri DSM 43383]